MSRESPLWKGRTPPRRRCTECRRSFPEWRMFRDPDSRGWLCEGSCNRNAAYFSLPLPADSQIERRDFSLAPNPLDKNDWTG